MIVDGYILCFSYTPYKHPICNMVPRVVFLFPCFIWVKKCGLKISIGIFYNAAGNYARLEPVSSQHKYIHVWL